MAGYVKTFRQIEEWEWYQDANTFRVFMHLILNANYREMKYQGKEIPIGALATTYEKISQKLAISWSQSRTAIDHLKRTGEIAVKNAPKFIIIYIANWAKYQGEETDERTQERIEERTQVAPKTKKRRTQVAPYIEEEGKNTIQEGKNIKDIPSCDGVEIVETKLKAVVKDKKEIEFQIDRIFETFANGDFNLLESLNAFRQMRIEGKSPLSITSAELVVKQLRKLASDSQTQIEIINQSIISGWKGLFQLKNIAIQQPRNFTETAEQDIARRAAAVERIYNQ